MLLIGMIHLPPLPDSPRYNGEPLKYYIEYAVSEAKKLFNAGFDGFIVENYNDYPFPISERSPRKLAYIDKIVGVLKEKFPDVLIGLNILRNSCIEALSIACTHNIDFIRVNAYLEPVIAPEGFIEPVAHTVSIIKNKYNCKTKIFADVNVKHAKHLLPLDMALYNTCTRGLVDGVIISGEATGRFTPPMHVYLAKKLCRDKLVIVGSGVNEDNIGLYIGLADAVIIGTSIKIDNITSNPIDEEKARRIVIKTKKLLKINNRYK